MVSASSSNKFFNWLVSLFNNLTNHPTPGQVAENGGVSAYTNIFNDSKSNNSDGSIKVTSYNDSPSVVDYLSGSAQAQEQYNYNLALQQQAQQFNSAEAEKQRAWEERMSNTAYQRGLEDMRAAGLNPWLMVQGSAASTASGSSASSSAGSVTQRDNGSKVLSNVLGSALSVALIARIIKYMLK